MITQRFKNITNLASFGDVFVIKLRMFNDSLQIFGAPLVIHFIRDLILI